MFTYRLKLMLLLGHLLAGAQCSPIGEDYASGVPSAGLLGNYAGGLTGGEALSKLDFSHEFSSSEHDQLGALGDHLGEESFPADYGSSDAGEEYAEASELHSHYEEDHKPVPGIDHGKGAFSYSSLYEFKDRDEHELHQLQHQALEQQVEHEQEHEHQLQHEHQHQQLEQLEHLDLEHQLSLDPHSLDHHY
ncbi:filaggrin [Drosophila miranda]|uniref:filaggrin n=1 Tax=Drosophila miranda TaxID=7229 RepID=UPI00143F17B6|nr:filaggrin [Drosophila miranda]